MTTGTTFLGPMYPRIPHINRFDLRQRYQRNMAGDLRRLIEGSAAQEKRSGRAAARDLLFNFQIHVNLLAWSRFLFLRESIRFPNPNSTCIWRVPSSLPR